MIIGHLPAGYILSNLSYSHFSQYLIDYKYFIFWGMLGSIAPDIDMLYFYFVDHGRVHHHKYFTHFPLVWGILLLISIVIFSKVKQKYSVYALIFSIAGFCHLLLDSIVGDIWWFAPFVDKPFALATVPALYKPWWVSFIFHWSFLLEIAVVLWAFWLWKSKSPENSIDSKR